MVQLMPLPLTALASVKSRLVLPFWYRLTQVVLDKGPLNGCVCVCVCVHLFHFILFQTCGLIFELHVTQFYLFHTNNNSHRHDFLKFAELLSAHLAALSFQVESAQRPFVPRNIGKSSSLRLRSSALGRAVREFRLKLLVLHLLNHRAHQVVNGRRVLHWPRRVQRTQLEQRQHPVTAGGVVSRVRRMNEVNPCRARLLPGWVTIFGWGYHLGM